MGPSRDVLFSDFRDPSQVLGGLKLTRGITNANFYAMLRLLVVNAEGMGVQTSNGGQLLPDDNPLLAGHYLLVADTPIQLSQKQAYMRTLSKTTKSGRISSFTDQVRERDNRCVLTNIRVPATTSPDRYLSFEAAHIVPLARADVWHAQEFSALITVPPPPPYKQETINSVQNGMLLRSTCHQMFDALKFSILVDDGYKIIHFGHDLDNIAGTHLDAELLGKPNRPPDALFRWHFEQAVLRNMRGAGQTAPEFDFPPGSDMLGAIMCGPDAAERMEVELFTRLAGTAGLLEDGHSIEEDLGRLEIEEVDRDKMEPG